MTTPVQVFETQWVFNFLRLSFFSRVFLLKGYCSPIDAWTFGTDCGEVHGICLFSMNREDFSRTISLALLKLIYRIEMGAGLSPL